MEYGPIRAIEGDTVLSPSLPRLGIRISPYYVYLGDLQYITDETHHVEEFIFISPNGLGHVARMLLVQFRGYLENKTGTYEYASLPTLRLDGEDYLYELQTINLSSYFKKNPVSALAHAGDYIRQRAYTLAGEMTYQRFARPVSADRRNEFAISYLESGGEPGEEPGIEGQDPQARALDSFTILH